ncbi:RING-H2 finger protein ATL48-like [Ziziphus jujuba]|uniref:RING-H2 finger protein ATL48-like n=1 Tax=Ziziphus jujuba TaxID=326968 RepID=A0ABM3ZWP4_ZIZJJ|nr:RING-H2 finger protein ATL48-like [Ziziphus jujuba]
MVMTLASMNVNIDVDAERVAGRLNREEEEEEEEEAANSSSSSSTLDICLNVKMRMVCSNGFNYEFPEIPTQITSISLPGHPNSIQNPTICRSSIQIGLSNCLSDPDQAHLHGAADALLIPSSYISPDPTPILLDQQQHRPISAIDLLAQRVASTASSLLAEKSDNCSDGFGLILFHFSARVEFETVLTGVNPAICTIFEKENKKVIALDKLKKKHTFQVSSSSRNQKEEEEFVGSDCRICLQDLWATGIYLMRLPNCTHVFHQKCILSWLKESNSCPLCRNFCLENLDDLMTDLTI